MTTIEAEARELIAFYDARGQDWTSALAFHLCRHLFGDFSICRRMKGEYVIRRKYKQTRRSAQREKEQGK